MNSKNKTRNKILRPALAASAWGVLAASSALAAIPQTLNYQGKLGDASGNPLSGSYCFQFKLYDAGAGGALLFGPETWSVNGTGGNNSPVGAANGVYSVQIGSLTAGGIPNAAFDGGSAFLEIAVSADATNCASIETLSPRERLTASGYSFHSLTAEKLGTGAAVSTHTVQGDLYLARSLVASTATLTGDAFSVGGATFVVTGGNVGIGTAGPAAKLQVNGADRARVAVGYNDGTRDFGIDQWDNGGGSGNAPYNYFQNNVGIRTTAPRYKLSLGPDGGGVSNILALVDELAPNNAMRGIGSWNNGAGQYGIGLWASLADAATLTNTRMFIDASNGNVGIGTTNPGARLHVLGADGDANGGLRIQSASMSRSIYGDAAGNLDFNNGVNVAQLNSAGNWIGASDRAYKTEIADMSRYGLETVLRLRPREYRMRGTGGRQIGFIGQEVKELVPEVVSGEEGRLGIAYGNIAAVLTKAVQEQQAEIVALKAQNQALQLRLEKLERR